MRCWQTRPLGETCAINPKLIASEAPGADAEVTFVPMAAVDEVSGTIARPELRQYRQVAKGYTAFRENDVLFAKITPCMQNGKAAIARGLRGGLGFGSTEFHVLRPSPGLLPQWVFAFIRQPSFRAAAEANFTGTAGQQRVPADFLRSFPIPVPPLSEQDRIVKLLDEADELRKLRVRADLRTAAIIPALFHKMFGDPATNPKHWPTRRLRELGVKFSDGPFGSNLKSSHYTPEGVRVIRLQNIGVGCLIDHDKAYISPEHFASLRKHECLPGDVLVGSLGEPNLRAFVLPEEIHQALNKADCVQIRPHPEVATAAFICWLLNLPSTLEMASGMILGQTRARISMGRLGELVLPVPPLQLQRKFARRVTEIRALEAAQATSRHRLEALFQSMLHRAFDEEL